jgi:hypothetical protein
VNLRLVSAGLLGLSVLLASCPTYAQVASASDSGSGVEEARSLFEEGRRLYFRGRYADAARLFLEAHRRSPLPEFLYNLAQAERLSGDCDAALEHYREFQRVASHQPDDLVHKLADMARCVERRRTARTPSAEASRPTTPAAAVTRRRPVVVSHGPRGAGAGLRTATGFGCLGGAVVSTGLGVLYALRAESAADRLQDQNHVGARWNGQSQAYEDSWRRSSAAALGFGVAAVVLAGTGSWLLISASSSSTPTRTSFAVSWHRGGPAMGAGLRF